MVVAEVAFVYGARATARHIARLVVDGYLTFDADQVLSATEKTKAPLPVTDSFWQDFLDLEDEDTIAEAARYIEALAGDFFEEFAPVADRLPAPEDPDWEWRFQGMPHDPRWTDYVGDSVYFGLVQTVEFAPLEAFPAPPPPASVRVAAAMFQAIGLEAQHFAMPTDCNCCS